MYRLQRLVFGLSPKRQLLNRKYPKLNRSVSAKPDLPKCPEFEFANLVELQIKSCELNKGKHAFGTRVGAGYEWMTYETFGEEVEKFRRVLAHHNIGVNDSVRSIYYYNCILLLN